MQDHFHLEKLREEIEDLYDRRDRGDELLQDKAPQVVEQRHEAAKIIPCGYISPLSFEVASNKFSLSPSLDAIDKAAVYKDKLWRPPNPTKVTVKIVSTKLADGKFFPPNLLSRILAPVVTRWPIPNIRFIPWTPGGGDSHIRIAFKPDYFWSAHGTDALAFAQKDETMGLGFTTDSLKPENRHAFDGYVLHEFGHAFGAVHEAQSPRFPYHWEEEYVINWYLEHYPNTWDEALVRAQIFAQPDPDDLTTTEFDPDSVMMYYFPEKFTRERVALHPNDYPSPTDVQTMTSLYAG